MIEQNKKLGAGLLIHYVIYATLNFLLIVLFFFATANVLFNFPLDKIMMVLLTFAIVAVYPESKIFSAKEFTLVICVIGIAALSSAVNLIFFPMVFFPAVGLVFSFIISRHPKIILHTIYYALLVHMILAIVFLVMAYAGIPNHFVYSLVNKGFGLYSERGFTATVQTFGTLCLTWLLIYFFRRDIGMNTFIDKIFFCINCIAVLLALNRSTYLFWMLILFFKERKLFIAILIFLGLVLIKFWKQIIAFLTVSSSLTSRIELLKGFKLSFVESNSLVVYLFGRGTNEIRPEILAKVKYGFIKTIENGYAMLLHTFGSLGLLFYISVSFYLIFMFLKINKWAEACFLFYFFFVTPSFTQEFVSVTFYFLLAVMFVIYNSGNKYNEKTALIL